ncbi:MAG: nucleotidyltransferase [Sphingobacteriales bacterium]|nr:nucleotidyltransferase [Sphingobacteriales bacterium]
MDIMDQGLLDFWRVLNKHRVQYIMVGGFAVNMNGFIRATKDSDIWLKDSSENRKNFRKAYAEMGYGDFASLETMDFAPGWTQFYIADGVILDIMTSMKGLETTSFDECYQRARIADLDGVMVPFLHINDLLSNKKAVARPKDQLDVLELEKIKKYLEEKGKL